MIRGGVAALLLAACTAEPIATPADTRPPAAMSTMDTGARDLRPLYRTEVCARLPADALACDAVLRRLPDEAPGQPRPAATYLPSRYRVALVPGLFAECLEGVVRPFADVESDLRQAGFNVHYLSVFGRGSTAENAERLAREFSALGSDTRPLVVFAHSKGLPDVLEFVVRYPEGARAIAAIVGVAGAANGSPLADELYPVYRDWIAGLPLPGCKAGTGDELRDLQRDVRLAWWQRHRSALTIPLFSIVAAPREERVSPILRLPYRKLARVDPRNDGQLLWHDQIVPGGYLLGYVDADHWGIVMPLSQALPMAAAVVYDGVPRTTLVTGALEVVNRVLAAAP
ncbi:MAG TPA: hypothetical protein VLG10_17365 [Methylomirabilota bacterium]|nr:hypothetical protein [Methylomirabilota bacterium]